MNLSNCNTRAIATSAFLLASGFSFSARADVQRSIADESFSPLVHLAVTPPAATEAYAVEESISGTALPTAISHQGVYDPQTSAAKNDLGKAAPGFTLPAARDLPPISSCHSSIKSD
jgi:hypothetical protein